MGRPARTLLFSLFCFASGAFCQTLSAVDEPGNATLPLTEAVPPPAADQSSPTSSPPSVNPGRSGTNIEVDSHDTLPDVDLAPAPDSEMPRTDPGLPPAGYELAPPDPVTPNYLPPTSTEVLPNVDYGLQPIPESPQSPMPQNVYGLMPYAVGPLQLTLTPTPAGTLGQTYLRPSHPVPQDEHPRTAMLAVRDDKSVPFMTVDRMSGIRMKSGIWLFESKRPLDPGACQIVRVEARRNAKDIEPYAVKYVRLIAGRIVYLDF